jgi:hypothetical protein
MKQIASARHFVDGLRIMKKESADIVPAGRIPPRMSDKSQHPSWAAFIEYCENLEHGEIEILKIQDGFPVLAEVTRKKVRFSPQPRSSTQRI